ncbi:iron chelate uptake ABC transporter family permease subunit [Companilactobacillus metriopterae]|uniref:iron chelate uptake ABC transporter family permease subunit n=1 Tax=Companilactobacillus metriopterae TaxID=1909267 RepID=UPI00100BC544|nr:iron ABC transporter permease [Companilactobacillus metriopterae]
MESKTRLNKFLIFNAVLLLILLYLNISFGDSSVINPFNVKGTNAAVLQLRLSRTVVAMFTGALISISGLYLQLIFRNNLVDPGLVGLTSSANFFKNLLVIFLPIFLGSKIIYGAVGSLLLIGILVWIKAKDVSPTKFVLFGVCLSVFFTCLNQILNYITHNQESSIFAGFNLISPNQAYLMIILGCILLTLLILFDKYIPYYSFNDNKIIELGIDIRKINIYILLIISIVISTVVGIVGEFLFLGIVIPNIVKQIDGIKTNRYFIDTILLGSNLMILSDFLGRNLFYPVEIPAALICNIICAPILFYFVIRGSNGSEEY